MQALSQSQSFYLLPDIFEFASPVEIFILNADCQYEQDCGTTSPIYFFPPLCLYVVYLCIDSICLYDCVLEAFACECKIECVLMPLCVFPSLSQDEQSHPSSVLSNGGSGRLTLGPLIRPHLVGISLRVRHSSFDTERNPDCPPPPHLPSSTLILFSFSFSSVLPLSFFLSLRHTHLLPLSASQLSHHYPRMRQNEDKLI